jgi:hypothetical protein
MEMEKYLSGYCRMLDAPRLVEVLLEDGNLTEVDCCYGSCPHQTSCPIATQIDDLLKNK